MGWRINEKKLLHLPKTDPEVREKIIKLLDRENAWEHVVMNYLSYVPRKGSAVSSDAKLFHAELNKAIGNTMLSWKEIRKGH
jgi:hypothetical protein